MNSKGCQREDIVVEVAAYVPVCDDGDADLGLPPMLELTGGRPYYCGHCDEDFKYWEYALEHLNEAKVAS